MSVLITGVNGFIGSNLQSLTEWDGIDREYDIRDYGRIEKGIRDHQTIIHLGALAGVEKSIENEPDYVETNVCGTYNIAKICWQTGKRLIFASSSSVYEAKSPYARSKQGSEDIISSFVRHGLDACILRLFTVFGQNNRKDMAVYKFTQAIREGEEIHLYGNCLRDFTYVQDLCRALIEIEKTPLSGTHDLGFGDSIPVMRLIIILENIIGKQATVIQKEHRHFDAIRTKANPDLMNRLGIKKTDFQIALKNTLKTI